MDLKEVFDEVSSQMKSDFVKAQKSLTHSGLKGDANEEVVKKFLRQYLPKSLDITTGMLVDSEGNQSKQLDIIICDSTKTPIFYQSGETRVIPIECAYAVIEVKAFLDKTELEKSYKNMQSVKALNKKAYFEDKGVIVSTKTLYGKEWDYWPIQHFVFAFDSPSLDSVLSNLNAYQNHNEPHKRIDSICILEKGVIMNQSQDGMFSALPDSGSKVVARGTSKPLLFFYTLISIFLNQASMKYFNLMPYIKEMKF
ncbi:DUF6602 domain-containing protein [Methylobacter sp. Wu8]|jgi:hypothetical protein|uniref:DUF6602 domain-containing protein n=1 Tax=Methylobacter sp. Wu8 TaxID=3118457 RepID=UPI002F2FAD89